MSLFISAMQKINAWQSNNPHSFDLTGLNASHWTYFYYDLLKNQKNSLFDRPHVMIFDDFDLAEEAYQNFLSVNNQLPILLYPGRELSPYSGVIASEVQFLERLKTLAALNHNPKQFLIITTLEALALKTVPQSFFQNSFNIKIDDIISPLDLARKLGEIGYVSSSSVEEPGTFSHKGEIFDIFPLDGVPVRLNYFDDLIETIHEIDQETQKTKKDSPLKVIELSPMAGSLTTQVCVQTLRENIPTPQPAFKSRFEIRKKIFQILSENQLFENYVAFEGLFHKDSSSLFERIQKFNPIFFVVNQNVALRDFMDFKDELRQDFERECENIESESLLPEPSKIYDFSFLDKFESLHCLNINAVNIQFGDMDISQSIDLKIHRVKNYLNEHINPTLSKSEFIKESLNFLQKEFKHSGLITFCSYTDGSKQEIKHLIELLGWSEDLKNRTRFEQYRMDDGFWYEPEKTIVISDADLFAAKKNKTQKKKSIDVDLFAEQLATLKIGDYVIHSEYGVGEYLGLESLEIGGEKSDFLILKYSENDKVYVPVYKLNLIQKHADSHAGLKVDSLRTNKFTALKARAKISVKQLAFDLLKLQAERQMSQAYAFSEPDHLYKEFELAFPFDETPDQTKAIEAVLENMQKPVPMDHLVCGDVGFGKTEVAMRAAFKAVEDKKQVALLVPTTILALQHYNSFVKRFKDFPIKIEFVSRFKTAKESKEIFNRTEAGHVDILIGTHKLLSDGLRFKDLGLVIVDEEQRFGVGHKEKLKLLKSSVDFLTLTATPIPRTLQMAFLGLRELSLIKTAPPKRQSIKTYIIKEDEYTLQMAIKKELQRGGQVFIVHNKVNDMEQFVANIRDLVPEAKIVYAHGQMSEKELEDRVSAFYNGDYQILIATTIIESGIDIPNANTMIIDRADTFGLAQLHQLRGRIGRSDKKAYAYFVIPRFKDISGIAQKRLHALQTYADMGSGFNIANVDLEIRGAGDILGASQSGHIEAIGLELYMELLKEAIQEIRGERKIIKKDIEIQTPFPAFIPNHYIKDSMDRLKNYKRISNCETLGQLEALREEFEDIFGVFPEEIHNLFTLLEVRIHLQTIGLKSLSVAGNNLILKFDKSVFETHTELRDKVVQYFLSRPKVYQFTPDFKVIYSHKDLIRQSDLIRLSKEIAEQIIPSK